MIEVSSTTSLFWFSTVVDLWPLEKQKNIEVSWLDLLSVSG